MSADNWNICPRCLLHAQQEHAALWEAHQASYGALDPDEFIEQRAILSKGVDEEDFRTFREDYEFHMRDGAVKVSYSGHCQTCSLGIDFEESHPIEGIDA